MEKSIENKRLDWIDFLRAIAILMVIWGHFENSYAEFFIITSAFKMPVFYAIAAYVFNFNNGSIKIFFSKLFKRIVIPWMILSLGWLKIIINIFKGNMNSVLGNIYKLISGKIFWFIPSFIISQTIYFFIRKLIRKTRHQYIALILCTVFGLFISRYELASFACIDTAFVCQGFMLFGYWYKNNEQKIKEKIKNPHLVGILLTYIILIVLSFILFPGKCMDIHLNKYYSYVLCGLLIFTILLFSFVLSSKKEKYPKFLVFIGQNTMPFYLLHGYAKQAYHKVLNILDIPIPQGLVGSIIKTIVIIIILSIISYACNRWLPFVTGRSKKRNK